MTHKKTGYAVLWLTVAITAPSASYVATLRYTNQESPSNETNTDLLIQGEANVARVVSTGDQQWACIPIKSEDSATSIYAQVVAAASVVDSSNAEAIIPTTDHGKQLTYIYSTGKNATLK